jgi:hypothetical protein
MFLKMVPKAKVPAARLPCCPGKARIAAVSAFRGYVKHDGLGDSLREDVPKSAQRGF